MRRELPSLNALQAFECAARHLSMSRAARELHVTQGAVSRQVRALEDALGITLFVRGHRSLSLTPKGEALQRGAAQGFDALQDAVRTARKARARPVTLSVLPSFGLRWLAPRLPRLRKRLSGVELRLHLSQELASFGTGGVDAAVRYGPGPFRGLSSTLLLREEVFPVCAPRLARRLKSPAQLARLELLHDDQRDAHGGWPEWLRAAGVAGIDGERGTWATDASLALDAAVAGQGVALGRGALVERDLRAGRLARPFAQAIPSRYAYWFVCTQAAAHRKELAAVREFLLEEAQP